jgi:hypothetical protein
MILLNAHRFGRQASSFHVFIGILLGSVLLAQHTLAQQPAPAKKLPAPAPAFVPLPKDIQCSLQFSSARQGAGSNGPVLLSGTVGSLTCWVSGNEEHKKPISLVSNDFAQDLRLSSKDFGKLKLAPDHSTIPPGTTVAIHADKIKSLRAFLQASDAPLASDTKQSASLPANPFTPFVASSEQYEETDPRMFGLDLQVAIRQIQMNADGEIAVLDMTVKSCTQNGREMALDNRSITIDKDNPHYGALLTTDYGKFRVQFDSMGGMSLYLTPSQKKKLMGAKQ